MSDGWNGFGRLFIAGLEGKGLSSKFRDANNSTLSHATEKSGHDTPLSMVQPTATLVPFDYTHVLCALYVLTDNMY